MNKFSNKNIWLVLGAGISRAAPSNIPLWSEMKDATIASILDVLVDVNSRQWHTPPDSFQFERTSGDLQRAISMPEAVMECLCDVYLEPIVKDQLVNMIAPIGGGPQPNLCHRLIAKLISLGKVKGIVTPNYDRLLEWALEEAKIPFQVVLPSNSLSSSIAPPIYKVHGSIDAPETISFLRTTYMRGLPKPLVDHLLEGIQNSLIIICGYSGNDVDLFPLVRKAITDPSACNETIIVNPSDLRENSPYSDLKNNLTFIKDTGTNFFAQLLNEPLADARVSFEQQHCTLLPNKKPFECALFVADALLSVKEYDRAHAYFYLADDIASDEQNRCGRGIATAGRSLCLFGARQNQRAINELELGRAMLESIDLEDVDSLTGPLGEGRRITVWLMRARHIVGLTALAVSLKVSDPSVKRDLVRIASIHCHSLYLDKLGHSEQTHDHLVSKTAAMERLVNAYESFLDGNMRYKDIFSHFLDICFSGGCIPELMFGLRFFSEVDPKQSDKYKIMLSEFSGTVGEAVHEDIMALLEHPGNQFEFRHKTWVWR